MGLFEQNPLWLIPFVVPVYVVCRLGEAGLNRLFARLERWRRGVLDRIGT